MPSFGVTTVAPPTADPVTLSDAKLVARVDGTSEDALITSLITAATSLAEDYTRCSFVTRTLMLTLDGFYSPARGDRRTVDRITLPRPPIAGVTSVQYFDTANNAHTLAPTAYQVNTAAGVLYRNVDAMWPAPLRPSDAVRITYTAGYGSATDVPEGIKQAILRITMLAYQREVSDALSDTAVKALLAPYVVRSW